MRTLHTWGDGEYCWGEEGEEELLDKQREVLLDSPCPARGQRYRECVCGYDPFEPEKPTDA